MKEFWVDYCASIRVKAEDEEEAKGIFYQVFANGVSDEVIYRGFNEIINIEEVKESEEN